MTFATRIGLIGLLALSLGIVASGQTTARLQTADTDLTVEAGTERPRLVSLAVPGQPAWQNRSSESLIASAEISGQANPIHWTFIREASKISAEQVAFVYESSSPHLRLTWEWCIRASYGPIEHQIRIENLDTRELWIPMQDSLAFDWQVDPQSTLEHLFIEKGANSPSRMGTHEVVLADGYHWTGTSSTYGDLSDNEPREIIPWSLVQRSDAAQSGWYAGIEFSGRTRISLTREKDSLKGTIGLNPDPSPFRTRLKPGEIFETPKIFLGGFRDGADGAGNVLRRWVRAVLGNPETWKNPNYPIVVNNSWGGGMDVNEEIALGMIRDSAGLGVEMFHVDAGWFRGVGDWYPNPKKFPHGLDFIADSAHKAGLKFGLWVDWTQAGALHRIGSPKRHATPKFATGWSPTSLPTGSPNPSRARPIDLGVPEAKTWAQNEVERIVYGLPSRHAGARRLPRRSRM